MMSAELSELEILREIQNLMNNERIRPEPEYKCFSKYLALLYNEEFLSDGEILQLINSHGIQLKNDVQYWLEKCKEDASGKSPKHQIPVVDLANFIFKDMNDIKSKLQELPSEWTVVQVTKKFSKFDVIRHTKSDKFPGLYITRFACGELAKRISPYSVTINQNENCSENIFKVLQNLAKTRREFYSMRRTNRKLYDAYNNTNSELMSFVKEFELSILKQWICLFHGTMEDKNLDEQSFDSLKQLVIQHCKIKKPELLDENMLNVIYQITLSTHFMKNKDIFRALKSTLTNFEIKIKDSEIMIFVESLKMLNISKDCAIKRASYNPVILILDNEFEMVAWEMIAPLSGQPVCRVSSLHLLYALYKYHQPYIENGFRRVMIDNTYCLVNPSKDLDLCEKNMKEFIKNRLPWAEVDIGKVPNPKDLILKLEEISAYLYCGHGSGVQYLKINELRKTFVKGLVLLFGCSSNIPRNCGGRTPQQNLTYTYITNGCPCVIGCIQDLGSDDADAACTEMLSYFMPDLQVKDGKKIICDPKEPNILKALAKGRAVCNKYWSKSAFVARGIPCKTVIGDLSKKIT